MKKASSGINVNANLCMFSLIFSFMLYICQDLRIARAYTAETIQKKTYFSLISLSVYPRSRRGAEQTRQGEGRCSRPPKTALEGSYLTVNSSSENRTLRPRRIKACDRIPEKKYQLSLYVVCIHLNDFILRGQGFGRESISFRRL